jgi:hypothetical protein
MNEMQRLSKELRKIEKKAETNPKCTVRIDRLAKKYEAVLKRMATLAAQMKAPGGGQYA